MLSKAASSTIFESLVWLDLGLNPGLPDHWRILYSLGQWTGSFTFTFKLFVVDRNTWYTDLLMSNGNTLTIELCANKSCLFGYHGISAFMCYPMPNPFYTNKQFYFKRFHLAYIHTLIHKNISISSYSVYPNSSISNNSVNYEYSFCLHSVKSQNSSIFFKNQFSESTVSM